MNVLISPWNHIYPYVLLECLHKSFFIFGIKLKNISKMNITTKKQIKHNLLRPRFSKFHVFDNNNDFYLSVGRMVFRSALINVFFLHNYNLKNCFNSKPGMVEGGQPPYAFNKVHK